MQTLTTAADVRSFFAANPARLDALSEAAQKTVRADADGNFPKGRIHPEARADFNSDHKGKAAYKEGAVRTVELAYVHVQPSGRKVRKTVNLPVEAIRGLAAENDPNLIGARGPLSKAAIEAAAEQYALVAAG